MTQPRPFEQVLETWLEKGPTSAPADLSRAIRIELAGRRQTRRLFGTTPRYVMHSRIARVAAAAVVVVAIAAGGYWLGGRGGQAPIGVGASSPTPTPGATMTAEPTGTPVPTASATPKPTATGVTTGSPCAPTNLVARIVGWNGAAGSRIAAVQLTNAGSTPCEWPILDQPQLVDGTGAVLINGVAAAAGPTLTLAAGDVVNTQVKDSNYCFTNPVAPVTLAFVMPAGTGRIVATPLSPTDTTGVPPCNGAAGSAGSIEMQPWAR